MYSVLFSTAEWPAGGSQISLSRLFEHTEDALEVAFTDANGDPDLDKLKSIPALFAQETYGGVLPPARVGNIHSARLVGREIHIEYSFDATIPPIPGETLRRSGAQIGLNVFTRSHWAVKDFDLYKFIVRNQRQSRRLPTAFDVSSPEAVDPNLVSVMMPFTAALEPTYRKIREVAQALGLECRRADNIWDHATVIQDVVNLIDQAAIVICDCTGKNANVFYEAGIAHAFGREVVLITQNADDVPFDLRHHRFLPYLGNAEGLERLAVDLAPRLQALRARV